MAYESEIMAGPCGTEIYFTSKGDRTFCGSQVEEKQIIMVLGFDFKYFAASIRHVDNQIKFYFQIFLV